jgi:serine/threonine-protein kinase
MKKKVFWQTDWFSGLLITLLFLFMGSTGVMSMLEYRAFGLGSRLSPSPIPNEPIHVISIDEESLNKLGGWPWPRSYIAKVINRLNANKARVIGLTMPLHTTQSEYSVSTLDEMYDTYSSKNKRTEKAVTNILYRAKQKLDTDGALAASLKKTSKTVLAITHGSNSGLLSVVPTTAYKTLRSYSLDDFKINPAPWFYIIPGILTADIPGMEKPLPPVNILARYSSAGYIGRSSTGSQSSPAVPLILKHNNHFYPSFSLVFASRSLGVNRDSIISKSQRKIELDGSKLKTDSALQIYPRFYNENGNEPVFEQHSFYDIYAGTTEISQFRDKDILIGITAPSLVEAITTPAGITMAPVMATAHIISNLLHNHLYAVPDWGLLAQLTTFALVAFYLMWILPRFRLWTGIVTSLLLLFLIVNTQMLLMIISAVWIPLMAPAAALLTGSLVTAIKQMALEKHRITTTALYESNQVLGKNLQSQGQLDGAFEKYRICKMDDSLMEHIYSLGLDYERKRQFNKAEMVFKYVKDYKANFRDIKERVKRNKELQTMVILPKTGGTAQSTMILTDLGVQKPVLGRYEIEKEIGRGAMGLVYLGKDPKIGRTVAIKTMALSAEFEGNELDTIKTRFFREAEAAGRLNHPNIVTIYDAGEEQELAYIAMDFLKGKDLSNYSRPDDLLPLETVLKITADVASALDYAHKLNVVHRDIKPANIIYDEETGSTKVTDFGVACLTDASSTKTGTMLGSPSFMSPEQVCGGKVDGRSDIFSLGITLFKLATGKLPFESESIAALTHKITNEKHPDIRKILPDAPTCLNTIINRSLQKEPDKRYKDGEQMAKALKQCIKTIQLSKE